MSETSNAEETFLQPKNREELFGGLIYVGKVFNGFSWPNLEPLLKRRLELLKHASSDLEAFQRGEQSVEQRERHWEYQRETYLAIVMFFSHVDAAALSVKTLLLNAHKKHLLDAISRKQMSLLQKPPERVGFEDLLRIQFSILPHAVGAPIEYGTIKQHALPNLFKLRSIRNRIVHPNGLWDLTSVDLIDLAGKDINTPVVEYMGQLSRTIKSCARRLVPAENRDKFDATDVLSGDEFK